MVGVFRPQALEDQRLDSRAVDFVVAVQGPRGRSARKTPASKKKNLGCAVELARGSATKHRHPNCQQEVLQQVEVVLHRLAIDGAIGRHRLHIENRGLGETGRLQEAAEAANVAHQGFLLNLLAQVGADVAAQVAFGIGPVQTVGSIPQRTARLMSKRAPNSLAVNGCMVSVCARPASRLAPERRSFRALEPVRAKRNRRRSIKRWTSSRMEGSFCTSSRMMVEAPCPSAIASSRSEWPASSANVDSRRRSRRSALGRVASTQVDFPVPRGPNRKKLPTGKRKFLAIMLPFLS